MSYAFYFFSLSEEEFNDIVQNQDNDKFNELAKERRNPPLGTSTQEFSDEFVELVENHHLAQSFYFKAKQHDVLAPMADDGDARWYDHDAVQAIAAAFEGVNWGSEIRKYCEENDEDFHYSFEEQVYIFNNITRLFKHAAANNWLVITYSS